MAMDSVKIRYTTGSFTAHQVLPRLYLKLPDFMTAEYIKPQATIST